MIVKPEAETQFHTHHACQRMSFEITSKGRFAFNFRELWAYHELFYFLIWRDIKIKYSQTFLGVIWVLVQPLATILIFSLILGKFAKMSLDEKAYPVFMMAALLPWFFFSNGFSFGSNSLVNEANLIKKVYFPRVLLPLSKVSAGLLDFIITLPVLFILMALFGISPSIRMLVLPFLMLFLIITTFGFTLIFSAMNVLFRDVKYAIPFLTQIWFFITPVVYTSAMVSNGWQIPYALNPMVGVVESFRWMVFGETSMTLGMLFVSLGTSIVVLLAGCFYFNSVEEHFADIV